MIELFIAIGLIALNGVFALSELAVVSARRPRLIVMAERGRPGARAALALSERPGPFLSTVQIGITLVAILAGAFSGAALGARLTAWLEAAGAADALAEPLGYGLVIGVITYLSVVVGELVPKHLALRNPEPIACAVAAPMRALSRIAAPAVWLLDRSTVLVLRVFGVSARSASAVTEEEVRTVVAEAASAGAIEDHEHDMIAGVLRLGDRTARGVMTPRPDVEWLDLNADPDEIRARLAGAGHSWLPVAEGDPEGFIGVVQVRDLLGPLLRGKTLDLPAHVRPAPVVPDTLGALDTVKVLQDSEAPMALVHDEYGHFEGVVTPADVLDAIAGAFLSDEGPAEDEAVRRRDGSWLLAGWMPADEMADLLSIRLPERRAYETAAGFIITQMGRLPKAGDAMEAEGWRFEVVDMDGRRVDKVLAERILPESGAPDSGPDAPA